MTGSYSLEVPPSGQTRVVVAARAAELQVPFSNSTSATVAAPGASEPEVQSRTPSSASKFPREVRLPLCNYIWILVLAGDQLRIVGSLTQAC